MLRSQDKTLFDCFHQFANYHRRWSFAVVPDALPNIADIKFLARRQDCFQKNKSIFFARRRVTRLGVAGNEIEAGRPLRTREGSVAHANQGDHLEWNAPHGQHGEEGDATLQAPNTRVVLLQSCLQRVARDLESYRSVKAAMSLQLG